MDHNLREMGISDQGVPRQMRRVGEAFYGRAQAYEAALGEPGERRVGGRRSPATSMPRHAEPQVAAVTLAAYVRQAAAAFWPGRRSERWRAAPRALSRARGLAPAAE